MQKLLKLELRKVKLGGYVKGALISDGVLFIILIFMNYVCIVEGEDIFLSYKAVFELISSLVNAVFIVMSSVLISGVLLEEYKSKTVQVLFAYPVSRKTILGAKTVLIMLFTFTATFISSIVLGLLYLPVNWLLPVVQGSVDSTLLLKTFFFYGINALAASGMGLIPLLFCMKKKSTPACVLSAVVLTLIVCSNNGGSTLSTVLPVTLSLGAAGVVIAWFSLKNAVQEDVIC